MITTAKVQEIFIKAANNVLEEFYGGDSQNSESLARMINDRNFDRVCNLLTNTSGLKRNF